MSPEPTQQKKQPEAKAETTEAQKPAECNVDDCTRKPAIRGLCNAHYQTHRGLANPKE